MNRNIKPEREVETETRSSNASNSCSCTTRGILGFKIRSCKQWHELYLKHGIPGLPPQHRDTSSPTLTGSTARAHKKPFINSVTRYLNFENFQRYASVTLKFVPFLKLGAEIRSEKWLRAACVCAWVCMRVCMGICVNINVNMREN